jgi:uncharacterized cupredoxin-like copper-binding protein
MNRRIAVAALIAALLSSSACGSGDGTEPGTTQEVHVELHNSRFVPDHFEFAVGTTVKFVVENTDPIDHEFLIGDEAAQQAHEEGTEAHHGAKPGELSIPIGETRTTTYTFDEPGTLLIGCHLPTHYDYGMRGTIKITG